MMHFVQGDGLPSSPSHHDRVLVVDWMVSIGHCQDASITRTGGDQIWEANKLYVNDLLRAEGAQKVAMLWEPLDSNVGTRRCTRGLLVGCYR